MTRRHGEKWMDHGPMPAGARLALADQLEASAYWAGAGGKHDAVNLARVVAGAVRVLRGKMDQQDGGNDDDR